MEKNKKRKLKRIVKKIKDEASKNALSTLQVHSVSPPVADKIEGAKVKAKIKKPKGELPDEKKEETGKENKEEPSELPRRAEKGGGDEGDRGLSDPNWWPWERG